MIKLVRKSLCRLPSFKKVIVACSGGVDSVVLAHVLKQLGHKPVLAHLNHQLRGKASDEDEVFVKRMAKKWEMECEVKRINVPAKGNLENNGRKMRYLFLESVRKKYQADFIAVAHHQDDQIETILMHALRGAGLRGMRGMEPKTGYIIRPFLKVSKKEILEYANKEKLDYRIDQSNYDLGFTRNRCRELAIPYLKKHFPNFQKEILKVSEKASIKLERLSKKGEEWIHSFLVEGHFKIKLFNKLSQSLKEEVLIQIFGETDLYQNPIHKVIQLIEKNRSGSRAEVKNHQIIISQGGVYFKLKGNDEKKLIKKEILNEEECHWGHWKLINKSNQILFVRSWQKGDRFNPSGMQGSKKLQDFFVDQKIPSPERKKIPVIVNEKGVIMAVGNYRVAKGAEELKTKFFIQNKNEIF